jgi:hypothetical protein
MNELIVVAINIAVKPNKAHNRIKKLDAFGIGVSKKRINTIINNNKLIDIKPIAFLFISIRFKKLGF